MLQKNIELFAWAASNMLGIDPNIVCHHIAIKPDFKPVTLKSIKKVKTREKLFAKW